MKQYKIQFQEVLTSPLEVSISNNKKAKKPKTCKKITEKDDKHCAQ